MKFLSFCFSLGLIAVAQSASANYCREYTETVMIGDRYEQAYGTACLQPDGSWEKMSAPRSTAPVYNQHYTPPPPPVPYSQPVHYSHGYSQPQTVRTVFPWPIVNIGIGRDHHRDRHYGRRGGHHSKHYGHRHKYKGKRHYKRGRGHGRGHGHRHHW